MSKPWFQRGYRRMLLDMHIPDWDRKFLSRFDPRAMVRLYQKAGLSSVVIYAQSHVGLCYWPTKTGKMHAGLHGRDIVGETLGLLRRTGIASCAYYSVVYNNWAELEHPEWAVVSPGDKIGLFSGGRYGRCCPNNPGYRDFALGQIAELLGRYSFDGIFFDMTFWPRICVCKHCRQRFRDMAGGEIPEIIDWFSPRWCAFQSAREQWMAEFADAITGLSKTTRPGITVYHNFATSLFNWTLGLPFGSAAAHDFLGADFYGDPLEQLLVSKFMSNLSRHHPIEFATSRCVSLNDHEQNKSLDLIRTQAMASTLFSAATLFIDAVNPDGTVNPAPYAMIRKVYDELAPYEPFLGGEAVEDVAIYFSGDSKMDFAENGKPLAEAALWNRNYPHLRSIRGTCRTLQQAHVPFGIITRRQLADLNRYKVIIVPNVLRMDPEEAAALREYVQRGGRLYASRHTSLTQTSGRRLKDFMLGDVFGCRFRADDLGTLTYLKPQSAPLKMAIAPQNYLSHMALKDTSGELCGTLRAGPRRSRGGAKILATLTLPYDREWGTLHDQKWSSIHSSPPWRDTAGPVILENRFGKGRAIYSAADIECLDGVAASRLFLQLIQSLLGNRASAAANTHPAVWMSVTRQVEQHRFIIGFLNYPAQLPAVAIPYVPFTLRPPPGKRFTRLTLLPAGEPIRFTTTRSGHLQAAAPNLEVLRLLAAEYA